MGKNPNYSPAYRDLKSKQMKERITKILLAKENANGCKTS
jgi:hypothetical protein